MARKKAEPAGETSPAADVQVAVAIESDGAPAVAHTWTVQETVDFIGEATRAMIAATQPIGTDADGEEIERPRRLSYIGTLQSQVEWAMTHVVTLARHLGAMIEQVELLHGELAEARAEIERLTAAAPDGAR
jgi:hypothetical protein